MIALDTVNTVSTNAFVVQLAAQKILAAAEELRTALGPGVRWERAAGNNGAEDEIT